jgi:hypothetical protein
MIDDDNVRLPEIMRSVLTGSDDENGQDVGGSSSCAGDDAPLEGDG